jgi:thioredoxin-related protein
MLVLGYQVLGIFNAITQFLVWVMQHERVYLALCTYKLNHRIMKKASLILALSLMIMHARSEGITFSTAAWKQVVENARKSNKIIFVDFYATWCGPCKGLEKEVFPNPEVAAYFNEHFISKRIDAEKEEQELVNLVNLEAYPTLAFFNADGKLIYKTVGAPDADGLIEHGKKVSSLASIINSGSWKKNANDLNVYLESLAVSDAKAAERTAADFLATLPKEELRKAENYAIMKEYIHDSENQVCKYVLRNLTYFASTFETLPDYIGQMADNQMGKAVAKKSPALLDGKADLDIIASQARGDSSFTRDQFSLWNHVYYFNEINDKESYATRINEYLRKYQWSESNTLTKVASKIVSGAYSPAANKNAIAWAEQAIRLNAGEYAAYWILAIGYTNLKNVPKSNAAMQNFLKFSAKDSKLSEKIDGLLSN